MPERAGQWRLAWDLNFKTFGTRLAGLHRSCSPVIIVLMESPPPINGGCGQEQGVLRTIVKCHYDVELLAGRDSRQGLVLGSQRGCAVPPGQHSRLKRNIQCQADRPISLLFFFPYDRQNLSLGRLTETALLD